MSTWYLAIGFSPPCDNCPDILLALLRNTVPGSEKVRIELTVADCGGNASVMISCPSQLGPDGIAVSQAWKKLCIKTMNGMQWPEEPYTNFQIIALCAREAKIKMSVHKRLKKVLKRMSSGLRHNVDHQPRQPGSGSSARGNISGKDDGTTSNSNRNHGKNPARSFHNFTSDKKNAKSSASAMRKSLMRCSSGLQDDVRSDIQVTGVGIKGCDAVEMTSGRYELSWMNFEWLVISFSAISFLPEQVRRMAAVVLAVMRGIETIEFIDVAFSEKTVATPIIPAGANGSTRWFSKKMRRPTGKICCRKLGTRKKRM